MLWQEFSSAAKVNQGLSGPRNLPCDGEPLSFSRRGESIQTIDPWVFRESSLTAVGDGQLTTRALGLAMIGPD